MPIRITVKGLTVRRAGRTLLDRVSLEAAPGRATVLMGPSGCGKSTLLRMLNRLDAEEHLFETEGSIHMDGEEILRPMGVWELAALRRRVGMVFQAPSPFPMSIGENIAYGIRLQERLTRRDLDVRIEEALTRAALFDERCTPSFGRAAAAALHRARSGGPPGGASSRRAHLRPRPPLNPAD